MMKKITFFLLALTTLLGVSSINAQTVLFSEDFALGIPATWQSIDNTTGTNGGTWTSVSTAVLNGVTIATTSVANGYAIFNSDLLGADGFAEDADIITPSFSCVGQSIVNLSFENIFAQALLSEGKVLISNNNGVTWTNIFTVGSAMGQNTFNGNPDIQNIDISTWAANQSNVKLKFNYTGDYDYWWVIDDIQVSTPASNDLAIESVSFAETSFPVSYLIAPFTFSTFCNTASETVSITVNNAGTSAITSFSAGFNNGSTQATQTFTIPSLAAGASTLVSFTTPANVDTFDAYYINAWVDMTTDGNSSNDTSNLAIMITADPDTITLASPYTTGFEQWPATSPADVPSAWWTAENANNDGEEFHVVFSPVNASAGDFALAVFGDAGTANTGGDDWAFSPCIYFDQTKTYEVSFKEKVGLNAGVGISESLAFHLCSDDNSLSSVQNIGSMVVNDTLMTQKTFTFSPNTSGIYNFGLHKNTVGVSWWLWIDEFSITEVPTTGCSAGILTSASSMIVCSNSNDSIVLDGTESTPGFYTINFDNTPGGTGAIPNFNITNITSFPWSFDNDINGFLSSQIPPLDTLSGLWDLTIYNVDATGNLCDSVSTIISVDFLDSSDALCSTATPCSISNITAGTQTACVSATNTYTQEITVTYSNAPSTGMLNVNGQMFTITSSPQTVILTGLTANGNAVDVIAVFSADAACTMTSNSLFTAPASCGVVPCSISNITDGTQTACVSATNTYTQEITVTYSNAPSTGMLNVNGQMFTIISSPQTVILTGLTANGNAVDVIAVFSADAACTMTSNSLFTAPANCSPIPCVPFSVSNNITLDTCGQNTGAIDITVSGGTGILSYSWTNGAGNMQDASNLASGNYSVTITDANLCDTTIMYNVPTIGSLPTATTSHTDVTNCTTPNGTTTVNVLTSNGATTIDWQDASSVTISASTTASNLNAGTYTVYVTDSWGCMASFSETVGNGVGGLTALIDGIPLDATCFGANDGEINTLVSGGTGPYSYLWSDLGSASTIGSRSDLLAGTYSILITDLTTNCTFNLGPIVISEPNEIIVSSILISDMTCNGADDGEGNALIVSGGNGIITYEWSDGNGNTRSVQNPNDLTAGNWTVTATDADMCTGTSSSSITITEPMALSATATLVDDISCNGVEDGSASSTVTGGVGMTTYSWTDGNGNFRTIQNPNDLSAGTWTLTATAGGCQVVSNSIVITEPDAIVATAALVNDISCFGLTDGEVSATVMGGVGAISYAWSDGLGNTRNIQNPDDLTAGTWTVVASDANCTGMVSNSITISEPTELTATSSSVNESSAGSDGTATVVPAGGTPNYTYSWSDGQSNATATGLDASNYTCTITDDNGCSIIETVVVGAANAINDISIEKLLVYPNPTSGLINVEFETFKSMNAKFTVFNILGKKVYSDSRENVNGKFKNQFDLESLSSGVYYLEIDLDNAKSISKITINK